MPACIFFSPVRNAQCLQLGDLNRGLSLGGSVVQNFVGVIVTYEFYPVSPVDE